MELVVSPLLYLVQVLLDLFILFVGCIDGFLQQLHLRLELAVDGILVVLHPRLHELDLVLHRLHEHHHATGIGHVRYKYLVVLLIDVLLNACVCSVEVALAEPCLVHHFAILSIF